MELNSDLNPSARVPLRVLPDQAKWGDVLAKWISRLGSPPLLAAAGLMMFVLTVPSRRLINWSVFYAITGILIPIAYIVILINRGELTDFHMRVRSQRKQPMVFLIFCSSVAMLIMWIGHAPSYFVTFAAISTIQTIFLTLVTLRWKISGHATGASALVVFLYGLYGPVALPAVLLIPIMNWARMRLRRHTFLQTLAGSAVGAVFMLVGVELIKYQCGGAFQLCTFVG
jgi:membrane-associated phospholipid phosphatase